MIFILKSDLPYWVKFLWVQSCIRGMSGSCIVMMSIQRSMSSGGILSERVLFFFQICRQRANFLLCSLTGRL